MLIHIFNILFLGFRPKLVYYWVNSFDSIKLKNPEKLSFKLLDNWINYQSNNLKNYSELFKFNF